MNIDLELLDGSGHNHLLKSLIQNTLRKAFSAEAFFSTEDEFYCFLPFVKMFPLSDLCNGYSALLVCPFYQGIEKFFYEMISRWLLPGQELLISSVISSVFFLKNSPEKKFSFCELRFSVDNEGNRQWVEFHFPQIASDIKMGSVSRYQAHKILTYRDFFSSQKNSLIHERIASLIQRLPEVFDYDVFGQMQHFFVNCSDSFKQIREYTHLSRIIYVFYLFRKGLKKITESRPDKRHISFKVSQVRLHQTCGLQRVLGVFVGLNFLKKHEIFEEKHLLKALQEHLSEVCSLDGSLFVYLHNKERIQIIYLEIQKKQGGEFSSEEIQNLRKRFSFTLEKQIEKLMPSLFMPRNEEEVMKNIVRLGQELKYLKDVPQVFISFEEQSDSDLTFTIILLRVLLKKECSIQTLFSHLDESVVFVEDRVKNIGFIRRKYPKEATVFRLKLPKVFYVRNDHSVDLLKARQSIVLYIQKAIGEFRDYNGGMIAKQTECLEDFKKISALPSGGNEWELETFFHGVFPVEMRVVISPFLLKCFYDLWREIFLKIEGVSPEEVEVVSYAFRLEKEGILCMFRFSELEVQGDISSFIKELGVSSSQLVTFYSKLSPYFYLGYLFLGLSAEKGERLKNFIRNLPIKFKSPSSIASFSI